MVLKGRRDIREILARKGPRGNVDSRAIKERKAIKGFKG